MNDMSTASAQREMARLHAEAEAMRYRLDYIDTLFYAIERVHGAEREQVHLCHLGAEQVELVREQARIIEEACDARAGAAPWPQAAAGGEAQPVRV